MKKSDDVILSKLYDIESQLIDIQKTNTKMNDHIDFVEYVYSVIKKPFFLLMSTVSKFMPEYLIQQDNDSNSLYVNDLYTIDKKHM
jgi:hypothetical protein